MAELPLASHGRFDYEGIYNRKCGWTWPGGAKLAVYVAVNLEHFTFGSGLGAELAPGGPQPDVLNFAWREWGNRVGGWRLLEMLDELRFPIACLANASLASHAPSLLAAYARHPHGAELLGHGVTNSEQQSVLSHDAERALIKAATLPGTGTATSRGWLSPWIAESMHTPDLLVEEGYTYTLNWCHDDAVTVLRTRAGPLLAVPYPQDGLNDIPSVIARKEAPSVFGDAIRDAFEELFRASARPDSPPLVMGVALHPYIAAQPHRIGHVRRALAAIAASAQLNDVWLCTPGQAASEAAKVLLPPP